MKIFIYWHIFASENSHFLNVFHEQFNYLVNTPIFNDLTCVNCCISGNFEKNFKYVINYLSNIKGKFNLRNVKFNDTSFERYTLNIIKEDLLNNEELSNSYIFYFHTKGTTKPSQSIDDWRQCMQYFLLENSNKCISKLSNYDTIGIFKHPTHKYPHYSGNFWWATSNYLLKLFNNNIIDEDYTGPEFFLFKGNPKFLDLYPMPKDYDGYHMRFPFSYYKDYKFE